MKGKSEGNSQDVFFIVHWNGSADIYVPTTSFKLMVLRNIIVEEASLSKGASATIKQTSHPV